MTDLMRIMLTAGTTVITGTLVYVFGQLTTKFLIEPCYEQRRAIAKVGEALLDYMPIFAHSGDEAPSDAEEAARLLRKHSTDLVVRSKAIPLYQHLARLRLVLKWDDVNCASRALLGLSNRLPGSDFEKKLELASTVADSLHLTDLDPDLKPMAKPS